MLLCGLPIVPISSRPKPMPRFAANLSLLFTELDFLDRFDAAAQAGFEAVEFQFPYAWPADQIAERVRQAGVQLVLHNLPAGDWTSGERGIACQPDRQAEFRDGVSRAIDYAGTLGCPRLNCLSGIPAPDTRPDDTRHTFCSNLAFAAEALQAAGLKLLIEFINPRDIPGFFLCGSAQAASIIHQVKAPNLLLQYDIYHAQRAEGELAASIEHLLPLIGHMQLADNPGRHEPGTGEINFDFLFAHIDRLGYDGWIGCEYLPQHTTAMSFAWLKKLRPSFGR